MKSGGSRKVLGFKMLRSAVRLQLLRIPSDIGIVLLVGRQLVEAMASRTVGTPPREMEELQLQVRLMWQ